jgi:LIVCS family branched-chain amino acid:cation transporter
MKITRILSVGFAMFAMLFGAGNVVFPLVLGSEIGKKLPFGLLGFVLCAVIVPLAGLISTMLLDGDYKKFLGTLGRIPGALVTFVLLLIIGPFAITPRTLTVAHSAVKLYLPTLSIFTFSVIAAVLIYACTMKKSKVMDILGVVLGPIQLVLLLVVVFKGLFAPMNFIDVDLTNVQAFVRGITEAYGTCDLLAVIFFSGLILSGLTAGMPDKKNISSFKLAGMGLQAGAFGALCLALVYSGFCAVAAFYSSHLVGVERGDIFSVLTSAVLGGPFGFLANMAVALSCFTTAIALVTVFSNYLYHELLQEKVSYRLCLFITIVVTAAISNLGFSGIMAFAGPIVEAVYPALLVLALVNCANKLFGFTWIKLPVYMTFIFTLVMQYSAYLFSFLN